MESYWLNTLIFYLKCQSEIGFKGIEQLLQIIDHKRYDDSKKRELIIANLHFYGLNEIGYRDGQFALGEGLPLAETTSNNIEDNIPIKGQVFALHIYNGTLEIMVPLN